MDTPQVPVVTEPTQADAMKSLENARLKAAIGFEYMVELITLRGFDPAISTTQALAVAEHLYKVSGMAQKQAVAPQLPTVKFSFNSNKAVNSVEIDVTPSNDLAPPPDYTNYYPVTGTALNALVAEIYEE
jgi:hypothetical protein